MILGVFRIQSKKSFNDRGYLWNVKETLGLINTFNLGNIKLMESYDILFPFSLSYMGYETIVETQHNNSGAIHS